MSNLRMTPQSIVPSLRYVNAQMTLFGYRTSEDSVHARALTVWHRRRIRQQLRRDLKASLRAILSGSQ